MRGKNRNDRRIPRSVTPENRRQNANPRDFSGFSAA
jgi:hypothetical protein